MIFLSENNQNILKDKEDYKAEVVTFFELDNDEFMLDKYRFLKMKMYLGHTGLNKKGFYISEEVFDSAKHTLANLPIVAKINNFKGDFEGHNFYEDADGRTIRDTDVMGVIPETHNFTYEVRNDLALDGIARKYLVVEGLLWTRNLDLMDIIVKKNGIVKQSLEMKMDGTLDEVSGITTVDRLTFEALCFLGDDIGEGMQGSKSFVTMFSENEKPMSQDTINKALKYFEKGAKEDMTKNASFSEGENAVDTTVVEDTVADTVSEDTNPAVDTPTSPEKDAGEEITTPTEENLEDDKNVSKGESEGEKEVDEETKQDVTVEEEKEEEKEPEKVEETEEESVPFSTYTDLHQKKKKLEEASIKLTALFDDQKTELEELRAYKFERESKDIHAEFSAKLPTAKVTEVIANNSGAGMDAIRTALFAELGKSVMSNSTVASFSEDKKDTFSVNSKTEETNTFGSFGEM